MEDASLKKLRCLIVEDHPLILLGLEAMLHGLGISQVVRAASAAKATAHLKSAPRVVDCILCDLSMPGGNGLELLKAIRTGRIPYSRVDTCFIAITAITDQAAIDAAVKLDANGYLVKPVMPDMLRAAIIRGRARHFLARPAVYAAVEVPQVLAAAGA